MPYPSNGGIEFEVYCSGAVAKSIREVHERAVQEGRGEAMVIAFREAVQQLKKRAAQFGAPLYRLPVLRMQVRQGLLRPIAVEFAVCEDRPIVFIKGASLLGKPVR